MPPIHPRANNGRFASSTPIARDQYRRRFVQFEPAPSSPNTRKKRGMKRYSIMVREYGSDQEVEACQIDGDPEPIVRGYQQKTLMVQLTNNKRRRTKLPKYTTVRASLNHQ
jgi:hypothetical protein